MPIGLTILVLLEWQQPALCRADASDKIFPAKDTLPAQLSI